MSRSDGVTDVRQGELVSSYNAAAWLVDRHVNEGRGYNVAVQCRDTATTYLELQRELWRAQRLLEHLEVNTGDRVALVLQDDLAFPSFFLGAQRSGAVPIPLSTMLTGTDLGSIIADCEAEVLVISSTFETAIDGILDRAPRIRDVVITGEQDLALATQRSAGDGFPQGGLRLHAWSEATDRAEMPIAPTNMESPAFWLYSSGTTGLPKGVMHVHGNLPATVDTYATDILQITENDRFLSIAKLFFAYGLGNSLTFPFAVGATAILEPAPPTPRGIAELINSERATLFFASPGFVAALLDAELEPSLFESVRATVTAGESLPANVQTRFADLTGKPVLDGIGSTELLHIFISNSLTEQQPGTSGRIVPGYQAELRDDQDHVITEPDVAGYLHVRGPSAAIGYWQRDEATAAAFRDGWVRTGDVYTRSTDDCWTFLGRNNDMIKAGGIWVSPAEVESVLIEHPDVLEAAVVGARDEHGLETAVAFVLAASGSTPDTAELEQHCRDRMAAFKRPRRIIVVDELPKTATGKIKRFLLRDALAEYA